MALVDLGPLVEKMDHVGRQLDRLIQLAEQGALSPTTHVHGEVTDAEAAAVVAALRGGS